MWTHTTTNFLVKEVKPNIYHFSFKDHRKCCLHFLRFQEFFESDIKNIKGKYFTFIQLMEAYTKKYAKDKHTFTYMSDWGGFNVPDWIFDEALRLGHYNDFHEYDHAMIEAVNECRKNSNGEKFYVIGSSGGAQYFYHEVAHGLWYTNNQYHNDMQKLINSVDKNQRKAFYNALKRMKYHKDVCPDEMQAYLSTGLDEELENIVDVSKEKEFKKIFKLYK